ncbi:MAG: helix-turn-helix transcriptional regulator [Nitrospinae bacterium]|nr:helix-turn-helix transcriptional regulator [Nitrospinota bacterium]
MAKTADELIAKLPKKRQERINKLADELIAEEMALQELRQSLELKQEDVAKKMSLPQGNISRMEQRKDMKVSTLKEYIEALGGKLRLTAEFPNRPPVNLTGFSDKSTGFSDKSNDL